MRSTATPSTAEESRTGENPRRQRLLIAYVELDEGPRILSNIADSDPEMVKVDQRTEVVFHDTGQATRYFVFVRSRRKAA